MADRVPTMDRSMNIALVDSTEENREKTFFGMDPERLNQVWDEIRKMEISAGTAMRKPYQNEKQQFKPYQRFMDSQVERFLEEFIIDKQIALHLGIAKNQKF